MIVEEVFLTQLTKLKSAEDNDFPRLSVLDASCSHGSREPVRGLKLGSGLAT